MSAVTDVLKVKDENGNWVGIPAIKGEKGDPGEGLTATDTNNDGNVVLSFE
jgi:hypothetical protein